MSDRYYGTYRGKVASGADPLGKNRVRVIVPQIFGSAVLDWAEPIFAGTIPDTGSVVWVQFNGGSADKPIYFPPVAVV